MRAERGGDRDRILDRRHRCRIGIRVERDQNILERHESLQSGMTVRGSWRVRELIYLKVPRRLGPACDITVQKARAG